MERTINLIGIGTDGDRSLTQEAKQLIGESTVLIGAKRMLKSTKKYQKENVLRYEKYRPEEVLHILETVPDGKISLLFSGDPGCYSGAEKMTEELCRAGWRVRICPGIASVIAMAARCQVPWERAAFVSLHGTDQNVIHAISTHEHTFILLGGMMTAEIFLEKMAWYGLDDLKAAAGRNLSYEDEVFYSGAVRDMTPEMLSGLTVLWVHHPEYDARVGRHLEDGELIRGSVPMTKSSVRAMVIAALRLQEDSVVYDIGAGTGSVAVETAMQGGGIRVYAIERNPEGVRLVQEIVSLQALHRVPPRNIQGALRHHVVHQPQLIISQIVAQLIDLAALPLGQPVIAGPGAVERSPGKLRARGAAKADGRKGVPNTICAERHSQMLLQPSDHRSHGRHDGGRHRLHGVGDTEFVGKLNRIDPALLQGPHIRKGGLIHQLHPAFLIVKGISRKGL